MGYYDTRSLPIYQYLHGAGAPALRDRRQLLPGRVRRVVPQPPVADRSRDTGVDRRDHTRRRQRSPLGRRRGRHARRTTRCIPATGLQGRPADPVRPQRRRHLPAAGPVCGDYAVNTDPAALPAVRPGHGRRPAAAAADHATIGDRLSRPGRRLGVVLRRLGQRQRRRRRAGLDQRHRGRHLRRPGRHRHARSTRTARTSCFQFHHQPFNYFANVRARHARPAPQHLRDEVGVHRSGEARARSGRSASSSRSARRTSTRATPARRGGSDHLVEPAQGDRGRSAGAKTRWSS